MSGFHFINLSNGVEALPKVENPHFVRIQSTACEQKRWGFVLRDLGYDFLLHAATGEPCWVYDFSSKRTVPRSIFQGLPWITYALTMAWRGEHLPQVTVRGVNVSDYFRQCYKRLSVDDLKPVRYAGKFHSGHPVQLFGVSARTQHDGDIGAHQTMFAEWANATEAVLV